MITNVIVILQPTKRPWTVEFLCPKRIIFQMLRSRFILSLILIEIGPKHTKNDLIFQPSTLSKILYPHPSAPVDKVHAPPKVKSLIRHYR